jgi:hypothetical protein
MASAYHEGTIQVDIVCRGCIDGRHGCARVWIGLGLKICCSCNCIRQAHKAKELSSTDSVLKEVVESI